MAKIMRWVANGVEFRSSTTELETAEVSGGVIGGLRSGLCSGIGLIRHNSVAGSWVIEIDQRIHIGEEDVLGFQIRVTDVVLVLSGEEEFEDRGNGGGGG